jgi:hypothetical protein
VALGILDLKDDILFIVVKLSVTGATDLDQTTLTGSCVVELFAVSERITLKWSKQIIVSLRVQTIGMKDFCINSRASGDPVEGEFVGGEIGS